MWWPVTEDRDGERKKGKPRGGKMAKKDDGFMGLVCVVNRASAYIWTRENFTNIEIFPCFRTYICGRRYAWIGGGFRRVPKCVT